MNSKALSYLSAGLITPPTAFAPYGYPRGVPTPSHITNFLTPVQFQRLSHDIKMWRDAIIEAELAFYPKRVRMQRMYMDTEENGYVKAVIARWKELTTQRDYVVYQNKDGKRVKSEVLTANLEEQTWFSDYIEYVLEALLYGYSYISLGDIVDDGFPNISVVPRENIIPDGNGTPNKSPILTSLVYMTDGLKILGDPLIEMCNHYIPTKPIRKSQCGYGLYYPIALLEVHLRHVLAWNVDYIEMFGQPIKKGSTRKTGKERTKFENFLKNSASNSYVLLDLATEDKIEYEMAASAGTAWKSYDNIENRLQGTIAQVLLGHTDGMKSTPGKLGGMQAANKDGFNESLVEQAMNAKQVACGNFVCRKINEVSSPLFRRLGNYVGSKIIRDLIPEGYKFGLLNDKEDNEVRRRTNSQVLVSAEWAEKAYKAGLRVDAKAFSDWTGFSFTPHVPETKLDETREIIEEKNKPESSTTETNTDIKPEETETKSRFT